MKKLLWRERCHIKTLASFPLLINVQFKSALTLLVTPHGYPHHSDKFLVKAKLSLVNFISTTMREYVDAFTRHEEETPRLCTFARDIDVIRQIP